MAYYEIAVADSNRTPGQDLDQGTGYTKTLSTDSTFVFKADPATEQQLLGYRFFVRAVDNEGKVDPTPAVAYFVARNDNFPEITFRPGLGTWTDRFGNALSRVLTSTSPDAPTDTIGVEGCISQTWAGFDGDPGGFVVRFEYKLGSQLNYQGGTLADTSATYCFAPGAPRKQLLQVRAVDDGGLRSPFDFIRSVTVNFDPITFVVHPTDSAPDGTPIKTRYFVDGTQTWPSGTTLADRIRDEISVKYVGYDDSREKQPTWELDRGISSYEDRVLYRTDSDLPFGGDSFKRIEMEGAPAIYPTPNARQYIQLGSGDHMVLIRARDRLLVPDSTPDSCLIAINYRPYITVLKARPESAPASEDVNLLDEPGTRAVFFLSPGEKLLVTCLGRDVHRVNPVAGSVEARYDSNGVVENEDGIIEAVAGGYRVYLSNVVSPPSFDNPTSPPNYAVALDVEQFGQFQLIAEVRDRTFTNATREGRRKQVIRNIELKERVAP